MSKEEITYGATMLVILAAVLWLIAVDLIGLPVVSRSWSTGECVRVDGPASCAALPDRYHERWVR